MEPIVFKLSKTAFKNTLTLSKRANPKKDKATFLIGKGTKALVLTIGHKIDVYDYITLEEEAKPFVIKFDPAPVDKWLDGRDRVMEFSIFSKTKNNKETYFLKCLEKKKHVPVKFDMDADKVYRDFTTLPYQSFDNKDRTLNLLNEVNRAFQKSDKPYAEYVKVTDVNMFIFNPLLLSIYTFRENIGISDEYGEQGIAIHQNAIDVLVKTIKKPTEFFHYLHRKGLFLKEKNTVFMIKYDTDVRFPSPREIKPLANEKTKKFRVQAEDINKLLSEFNKAEKISIRPQSDNTVHFIPDNQDDNYIALPYLDNVPKTAFPYSCLTSFFDGLSGEVEIIHSIYESNATKDERRKDKEHYAWFYRDASKMKILPVIIEAKGYN